MWGYQPHFYGEVKIAAKSLFDSLDKDLSPRIILVGIRRSESTSDDLPDVQVQSDDIHCPSSVFADVAEAARHIEAVDPGRRMSHSDPVAQAAHELRLGRSALKKAIETAANTYHSRDNVLSSASWAVPVDDYLVTVVLVLDKNTYEPYNRLRQGLVDGHIKISTSLLDSCISNFLSDCANALRYPDPGLSAQLLRRESDELVRAAGRDLMETPAWCGRNPTGSHGLFQAFNAISSLRYEGEESSGEIVLCRREHPNVEIVIEFRTPVALHSFRAARKLLEMAKDGLCLVSDSCVINGLGRVRGSYDCNTEDLFVARFRGHHTWELLHNNRSLMSVSYGLPRLPKKSLEKRKFFSDMARIFRGLDERNIANLWELTEAAQEQPHGTILLISSEAEAEAQRLENQCLRIAPARAQVAQMRLLTSIDGAILIDPTGTCHALGMILDGLATMKGNSARGARYNSAVRYVDGRTACVAVVVSEDKTVELVPDLRPQVSRSALLERIELLESLKQSDPVDVRAYNKAMRWLTDRRFYCLPEYCERINVAYDAIVETMPLPKFLYNRFVSHPEMDESYFH